MKRILKCLFLIPSIHLHACYNNGLGNDNMPVPPPQSASKEKSIIRTIKYQNGESYHGESKIGANQEFYPHGKGTIYHPPTSPIISHEAHFLEGLEQTSQEITIKYKNGLEYKGCFKLKLSDNQHPKPNGQVTSLGYMYPVPQGKGEFTHDNKDSMALPWKADFETKNGKTTGISSIKYRNGYSYTGGLIFDQNKIYHHGEGIFYYGSNSKDRLSYYGIYENGNLLNSDNYDNYKIKIYYRNGNQYTGDFELEEFRVPNPHGHGKMSYSENHPTTTEYTGCFQHGKLNSLYKVNIFYKNGDKYTGRAALGSDGNIIPEGEGELMLNFNSSISQCNKGFFQNGKLLNNSRAQIITMHNAKTINVYDGYVSASNQSNALAHGLGELVNESTGVTKKGQFEDGVFLLNEDAEIEMLLEHNKIKLKAKAHGNKVKMDYYSTKSGEQRLLQLIAPFDSRFENFDSNGTEDQIFELQNVEIPFVIGKGGIGKKNVLFTNLIPKILD